MTYTARKQYCRELAAFVCDRGFDHFVTLAFNRDKVATSWAQTRIMGFDARLDRQLVGRDWRDLPYQRRVQCFYVLELGHLNRDPSYGRCTTAQYHFHLAMQLPTTWRPFSDDEVAIFISDIWAKIVPGGTVDVQSVRSSEDRGRICSYLVKQLPAHPELIEAYDFLPPTVGRP